MNIPAGASSASLRAATCGSRSASDRIVKELSAPTKPTVQLLAVRSPSVMLAEIACTQQEAYHSTTKLTTEHQSVSLGTRSWQPDTYGTDIQDA